MNANLSISNVCFLASKIRIDELLEEVECVLVHRVVGLVWHSHVHNKVELILGGNL